jgi:hypothetical protein
MSEKLPITVESKIKVYAPVVSEEVLPTLSKDELDEVKKVMLGESDRCDLTHFKCRVDKSGNVRFYRNEPDKVYESK